MSYDLRWYSSLPLIHQISIANANALTRTAIEQINIIKDQTERLNLQYLVRGDPNIPLFLVEITTECSVLLRSIEATLEEINRTHPFQQDRIMVEWLNSVKLMILALPMVLPVHMSC